MSRTNIVALLVLCVLAPGAVHAQQSGKIQRIGMITMLPIPTWRTISTSQAFLTRLHELGYDEGRNIALEHRSAEGNLNRLPDVAAEVIGLKVDVILANVCDASLKAAMKATSTMPIVVAACNDDTTKPEGGLVVARCRITLKKPMNCQDRMLARATPAIAQRVWEARQRRRARTVADALALGGRPAHYTTIARWKSQGWKAVKSDHPLEAARGQLEAVVPLVSGDPETNLQDLIDEPAHKRDFNE